MAADCARRTWQKTQAQVPRSTSANKLGEGMFCFSFFRFCFWFLLLLLKCLSVRPSVYLSVCRSVSQTVSLSLNQSVRRTVKSCWRQGVQYSQLIHECHINVQYHTRSDRLYIEREWPNVQATKFGGHPAQQGSGWSGWRGWV